MLQAETDYLFTPLITSCRQRAAIWQGHVRFLQGRSDSN